MKSRVLISTVVVLLGALASGCAALWIWSSHRDDGTSISWLIRRLKVGEPAERREAATALGQVVGPGAETVAANLMAGLRDRDFQVRARSARSLGAVLARNSTISQRDSAVLALTDALNDQNRDVRASAAIGLWSIQRSPAGIFEAAVDGVTGDDAWLQVESAIVLGSLPLLQSSDLQRILALLDDPSPSIQQAARQALIRPLPTISTDISLPVLRAILDDGSPRAREVVATMLGRSIVRVMASRDLLMIALKDPQASVRLAAAAAMGAFSEDTIARLALQLATDDPDLRVRATAAASLAIGRRATRAEAFADLRAVLEDDPARRQLVDEIKSDPDRATPQLLDSLRDRNPRLRAAAARCLGEVADRPKYVTRAIEALTLALHDRDPFVRRASAASLGRYGAAASGATEALKGAMRDVDRGVSGQALITLKGLEASLIR